MRPAGREEDQYGRIVLGDGKSPFGKYRIRKELNYIRKGLVLIVLEEVKV